MGLALLDTIDGQLVEVLRRLNANQPYGSISTIVRQFIEGHTSQSWHPEALFRGDWEDQLKKQRSFTTGWIEAFCMEVELDEDEIDALVEVGLRMVRYAALSDTPPRKEENTSELVFALRDYLALRGKGGTSRNRSLASKAERNVRAREILKKRKGKVTARKLAKELGCSASAVVKLPAWRAVQEERKRRGEGHSTIGKVLSLTPSVAANEGRDDPELERLIAEQRADDEGSPLISMDRHYRRRPGRRKL